MLSHHLVLKLVSRLISEKTYLAKNRAQEEDTRILPWEEHL
jgi:hypothetical protein